MNESLRSQYRAYLAGFGLKPRPLPPNYQELQEAMLKHMAQLNADDPFTRPLFEALMADKERYRNETRHPATILLEKRAEEVEKAISARPAYSHQLPLDVFVGEFPTGRINAEAVRVDGGYLVLVDSGALVVIQQVAEFLVDGDPDHPDDREANRGTVDGIVDVLDAYLEHGDPFFGPRPLTGGLQSLLKLHLREATQRFIVAHEYAHILAGHFNQNQGAVEPVETRAGVTDTLRKEWAQELEADTIGYKLLLGVDEYSEINLAVIDKPYSDPENCTGADWSAGLALKSALAAPFIMLTIDLFLETVSQVMAYARKKTPSRSSHPPARERMDNVFPAIKRLAPKYAGFVNYAGILWAHETEISERLVDRALKRAGIARPVLNPDPPTD